MDNNTRLKRVPTYIESFDIITSGGIINGSLVLLMSEVGAGGREYMHTSIVGYYHAMNDSSKYAYAAASVHPSEVCYISQRTDAGDFYSMIEDEFELNDSEEYHNDTFKKYVKYIDAGKDTVFKTSDSKSEYFKNIISWLENLKDNSVIFLDSLNPYLSYFSDDDSWNELITMLYYLRRVAKSKKITFVFLLTKGVLASNKETEISDVFDAVFCFFWETAAASSMTKQRKVFVEKYDGNISSIDALDNAVYNVSVSPRHGFEISNLKRVT
ncbi:MAG TPA: hypothetical protein O0W90_04085 [Methanocorpusculum sp.]|nr:hypothetical protein [Methanocorpusculum sp.]